MTKWSESKKITTKSLNQKYIWNNMGMRSIILSDKGQIKNPVAPSGWLRGQEEDKVVGKIAF